MRATLSPHDTPVHQYTLENGLKLYVIEDHRAPIVITQIWYKIGSNAEPGGRTGLSHLLEHMMFQGTKTYPEGAVMKIVAENGGQQNAFTTRDYTVYFEKFSADKLPIAFKLEADRMHILIINQANFKKELRVVQEERRMRVDDNPTARAYERFNAAAHIASPYHHMTIGWMNDLKHLTVKDAKTGITNGTRPTMLLF